MIERASGRGTRRLLGLVLFLVAASAVPGATNSGASLATPSASGAVGNLYLALGDSVAAGVGAGRPHEGGYAALVHGFLERQAGHPVDVLNLAVPGETTATLLAGEQMARARSFLAAARDGGRRPGPITLTIGANDLIRARADFDAREEALREVAANLEGILADLRAATRVDNHPLVDLVVTTYYDPTGTDPTLAGTDGWWIARLNEVIARETGRAGGRVADIAARFRDGDGLTRYPSDIHPTDTGHKVIAVEVWRTLGYDTTPPRVRIDRPAAGALARPVPTVAAEVTDAVGVVDVQLLVDGVATGPLPFVPDAGLYLTAWDARAAAPGAHTLAVRAVDGAGNEAAATVVVEVLADAAGMPPATPAS